MNIKIYRNEKTLKVFYYAFVSMVTIKQNK